jgi:hypothetical protein
MARQVPAGGAYSWVLDRARLFRIVLLTLTGVVLILVVAEFLYLWPGEARDDNIGEDYRYYVSLGQRWLDTGVMYGARQLTGQPYHVLINVDNLYPPPATVLFAAFVFLPWFVWFAGPVLLVAYAVWRQRPAMWTWPLMGLCLLWPRTQNAFMVGNSDVVSAGFVAAGLIWAWPSVLGLFKPAYLPFVLIGIRHRSWWIGLAGFGVVSLLLLPYWPEYVTAATNWDLPLTRNFGSFPILLIPVIAWLGRQPSAGRRSDQPAPLLA